MTAKTHLIKTYWILRGILLAGLVMLAGCATPRQTATPSPHYKVGNPYQVKGRWYYPAADPDYDEKGVASWYGKQFHGRRTANGEVFDMHGLSAAHKTLPLPSLVEVKNLENGRKIVLRVNDRGPFAHNRVIDLSRAAAKRLGFLENGLARVRVRYVGAAKLHATAARRGPRMAAEQGARPDAAPANIDPPNMSGDSIAEILTAIDDHPATASDTAAAVFSVDGDEAAQALLIPAVETAAAPSDPGAIIDFSKIPDMAVAPSNLASQYIIRVAALSQLNNIEAMKEALDPIGPLTVSRVEMADGEIVYRINMGPFAEISDAENRLEDVRKAGYKDALLAAMKP